MLSKGFLYSTSPSQLADPFILEKLVPNFSSIPLSVNLPLNFTLMALLESAVSKILVLPPNIMPVRFSVLTFFSSKITKPFIFSIFGIPIDGLARLLSKNW